MRAAATPRTTPRKRPTRAKRAPAPVVAQIAVEAPLPQVVAPTAIAALALDALSIREVARAHRVIEAMLERGEAQIDVSALGSIDTAGLQLLLIAAQSAQARGLKLRLLGAERLQRGAAAMLGLDAQLATIAEIVP